MTCHYALALAAAGHRVKVIYKATPPPDKSSESILPELMAAGIESQYEPRLQRAYFPGGCKAVEQQASQHNLIINTQIGDLAPAAAVGVRVKKPCLLFIQNSPNFNGSVLVQYLKRAVYRQAVSKRATFLVCVAEGVREQMIKEFGVPASKVVAVPNALDMSAFPAANGNERDSVRQEFSIADDELLAINIARIDRQKGQDILVRAVAQMKDRGASYKFLIVGGDRDGKSPFQRRVKDLAEELGVADRFIWAGFRHDAPRLLYGADVSVLPSRWEGLPIAALESFASATPILMSEYGKRFEGFIDGNHGWYVAKEDPAAFAKGLENVSALNRQERANVGRQGQVFAADNLNLDKAKASFVAVVESVIAASRVT